MSPQLQEYSQQAREKHGIEFDLLSDTGNQVARQFRIVHRLPDDLRRLYSEKFNIQLPEYNGDESWELPMPARYIIDTQSVIRDADVNPDHTKRPEPREAVRIVRDLSS